MQTSPWKTVTGLLLVFLISLSAEANSLFQTDISAGCGVMSGDTEYRIGGRITTPAVSYETHFPISQLKFPIDVDLLTLQAGITLMERLSCSISWGKELASDPDKMKDYDWETSPAVLSIYSTSSLDMEADIMAGKIQYSIFQVDLGLDRYSSFFSPGDRWQLLAGAEYLYRQFDFTAYDTLQTYPGYTYDDFVSGRTINYSVEYRIPFLELGMLFIKDRSTTGLSVGYSPLAEARDEDRHLLRNMSSSGNCEGEALMFSFTYNYNFFKCWRAALSLSQLQIETDGTLRTYTNGRRDHSIEAEIESRQFLATLELGLKF